MTGDFWGVSLDNQRTICVVQTLSFLERNWDLGFPPYCEVQYQGWSWGCISVFLLDVHIFSVAWYEGISQLVPGFLSKGVPLCVAVYSVLPWEKGNSWSSCNDILMISLQNHPFVPFYGWVTLHCMALPWSVYLLICWWTLGLILLFGSCEWCCCSKCY